MGFSKRFYDAEKQQFSKFYMIDNKALFERSCNGLNLCKNSILKVKGSITVTYYNVSFLPGHSLIFLLPTVLKLEVNDETGTVSI